MAEQQPSVGRWVHYVLEAGPNQGEHRPAVIVRIVPGGGVVLHVHLDSPGISVPGGDFYKHQGPEPFIIQRQPLLDPQCSPGTWHWPEFVPAV